MDAGWALTWLAPPAAALAAALAVAWRVRPARRRTVAGDTPAAGPRDASGAAGRTAVAGSDTAPDRHDPAPQPAPQPPSQSPSQSLSQSPSGLRDHEILEIISRHASDGIVIQDMGGRIEWVNDAYVAITGYPAQELLGRNPLSFMFPPELTPPEEEVERFRYGVSEPADGGTVIRRNIRKNGELFWMQIAVAPARLAGSGAEKVILVCRDVSRQVEQERALEDATRALREQARRDPLTGLSNRLGLEAFLSTALRDHGDRPHPVAVLQLDLNRFKSINDTFGHAAGDAVLVETARRLGRTVPEDFHIARIGGDEFVVVSPGTAPPDRIERIGLDIVEALNAPLRWNDRKLLAPTAVGIAFADHGEAEGDRLIGRADFALYRAKEGARSRVQCFDGAMHRMHRNRQKLAEELRAAVDGDQFRVHLQPVVDFDNGVIEGFEALLRWYHPVRGVLLPGDFLPLAGEMSLSVDLDRIAVDAALATLPALRAAGGRDFLIGVNLSPESLLRDGQVDELKWAVDAAGFTPDDLVTEVVETTVIGGRGNRAAEAIAELHAAGFRVLLDDFGVGYAGLAHLAELRIRGLKIDRAFVAGSNGSDINQRITRAVRGLCREIGLGFVAEGVESAQQATRLAALGCGTMQGRWIAEPMPLARTLDWLKSAPVDRLAEEIRNLPAEPGPEAERASV